MSKRTAESKLMGKLFKALRPGEVKRFKRQECVIRFTRLEYEIQHTYEPGHGMSYTGSFADVADWFTEDDGKGKWEQQS